MNDPFHSIKCVFTEASLKAYERLVACPILASRNWFDQVVPVLQQS